MLCRCRAWCWARRRPCSAAFDRRLFVVRTVPVVTVVTGLVVAVLVLFIWWRRRREVLYGYCGLATLFWAVAHLDLRLRRAEPGGLGRLAAAVLHLHRRLHRCAGLVHAGAGGLVAPAHHPCAVCLLGAGPAGLCPGRRGRRGPLLGGRPAADGRWGWPGWPLWPRGGSVRRRPWPSRWRCCWPLPPGCTTTWWRSAAPWIERAAAPLVGPPPLPAAPRGQPAAGGDGRAAGGALRAHAGRGGGGQPHAGGARAAARARDQRELRTHRRAAARTGRHRRAPAHHARPARRPGLAAVHLAVACRARRAGRPRR